MEAKTLSLKGGLKEGLSHEGRCEVMGSWERAVASGLVKDFGLDPRGSRQHLKGFSRAVASSSSDGLYIRMSMAGGGGWIG